MLLDRTMPNEQQGFGDYLSELGERNGFQDVKRFKLFLANSSKGKYFVCCGYSGLVRVVSGLFIELGLDKTESMDVQRPQCFRCINTQPKKWVWKLAKEARCQQLLYFSDLFKSPREKFHTCREDFCGLMMCSAKRLGLNFSPEKEGLYYADLLSKEERDKYGSPRIYAEHNAFKLI